MVTDLSVHQAQQDVLPSRLRDQGTDWIRLYHGPGGHGNPFAAYPRIGWQHSAYVTKALQDYKGGERASDGANQMMRNVASLLKDDEIRALASYVQGLD